MPFQLRERQDDRGDRRPPDQEQVEEQRDADHHARASSLSRRVSRLNRPRRPRARQQIAPGAPVEPAASGARCVGRSAHGPARSATEPEAVGSLAGVSQKSWIFFWKRGEVLVRVPGGTGAGSPACRSGRRSPGRVSRSRNWVIFWSLADDLGGLLLERRCTCSCRRPSPAAMLLGLDGDPGTWRLGRWPRYSTNAFAPSAFFGALLGQKPSIGASIAVSASYCVPRSGTGRSRGRRGRPGPVACCAPRTSRGSTCRPSCSSIVLGGVLPRPAQRRRPGSRAGAPPTCRRRS